MISSITPAPAAIGALDRDALPAHRPATALEVVIVSAAGGCALLRACLRSLERHPPAGGPPRVWVVDNASRDGTAEMVCAEFPRVRLVALARNRGFCAANNLALRRTVAPVLLLLNPDTEVFPGALDRALATLHERPRAAVVGVRLVRPDGSFDHAAKRSFPTIAGALGHFAGLGAARAMPAALRQYRAPALDEHDSGEVDAVNGAFMLIRREAIDAVGLLDERYRMYGEDLDWCYRCKRAGWEVFYDGGATVLHVKGALSVTERGRARHRSLGPNIAFHRAMGRFYRKHYGGARPLLDLLVYAAIGAKLAVSATRSAAAGA